MRKHLTVALALFALVLTSCGSSSHTAATTSTTTAAGGSSTSSPVGSTTAPAGATGTRIPANPTVGHVFVIMLENKSFAETWSPTSPAKYLNQTLRPKGQLLTDYYGISHVSLGNYIAMISGQAPNPSTEGDCPIYVDFDQTGTSAYGQVDGKGCVYPSSVKTVANQLSDAGMTWKAYEEDIGNDPQEPTTCRHPVIGKGDDTLVARLGDEYATRHDPFVYFHSIIDTPACKADVVGLQSLTKDLGSVATTPNLSYITPNLCDDGHDAPCVDQRPGGLTSADAFLAQWVPKILASPAYKKDGLLVITFDEAEVGGTLNDAGGCCHTPPSPNEPEPGGTGPGGGRVGALLLSPFVKPGTTNATPYNHYSLLCSIENAFGFSHLGFAGAPGLNCFGSDVYGSAATKSG